DFDGIHFGIYVDYELSGVVSLFMNDGIGQFRKLAVLPEAQHQGLGTQLMDYLIDFCKVQKLTKLWCNARVNSKEFYIKFGLHETDQTYSAAGFDFVRMELKINQ
ncbi:MAG: GNAT family N-acetyltransferase, partial [Pedobacter sp.]|nr:GNAT family N-acetyltransferase [Pedobacter sp.]